MDLPDDTTRRPVSERRPRRQFAAAHRQRAVGRAQAHGRDRVRPGPRARRDLGLQAPRLGPLLLHAEGRECVHRRGDLARQAAALAFRPEDGAEVIATGKLTTYPGRSKYQIVVERMELAGEGALLALLERRRQALAAEGLFDAARKRRLPFLPRVIGVVTSPTGAVIRDILHRLEDRCPTHVIVWPVPVQGEGAAAKIAAAIRGFADDRAAARPADRRPRRRLDRGSVGVQRGGGGARRGRIADPADLGGRPRDRHHADRLRRRPAARRLRPRRRRSPSRCAPSCSRSSASSAHRAQQLPRARTDRARPRALRPDRSAAGRNRGALLRPRGAAPRRARRAAAALACARARAMRART